MVDTGSDGFGTQNFKANIEFLCPVSAVWPFEVKGGMEGEHTQETVLSRCHQNLEVGERFDRSDLRLKIC